MSKFQINGKQNDIREYYSPYVKHNANGEILYSKEGHADKLHQYLHMDFRSHVLSKGYAPTRSQEVPVELLGDYAGYLQIDGYEGYNKVCALNEITPLGCDYATLGMDFLSSKLTHCRSTRYIDD